MTTTGSADTLRDRLLAMADELATNYGRGDWADLVREASALVPAESGSADRPLADRILNMVREHDNGICSCVTLQECDVQVLADVTEALASSPVQPEPSSVARGADDLVSQVEAQQHEIGRLRDALANFAPGSHDGLWGRIKAWIVNGAPTRTGGIAIARQITEWQVAIDDATVTKALAPTDAGSVRTTKD